MFRLELIMEMLGSDKRSEGTNWKVSRHSFCTCVKGATGQRCIPLCVPFSREMLFLFKYRPSQECVNGRRAPLQLQKKGRGGGAAPQGF